ncbi:hypothetical protein LguiB_029459 [Lonicera macranthoides]
MGDRPIGHDENSLPSLHSTMLQDVLGSSASTHLLHSYKRSFNGFVAMLTEDEKQRVSRMDGVISVFPNGEKKLHTTRSWDFMGFPQQVNRTTVESDIIVGVFDSGIWPESQSFSDTGYGPPPRKWKGACATSSNFTCNKSPRDIHGHGTHTASTAAGGLVDMASVMGFALGTARGGVPSARIAVYKVCWTMSVRCRDADILSAFDDAIADGVDIISLSLGGLGTDKDYFNDVIAIGSFHAMRKGILTSASAGNDGRLGLATVSNVEPWSICVAASSMDRKFSTKVELGNNMVYEGVSINTFDLKNRMYPLVYAGAVPNTAANFTGSQSRFCNVNNSMDPDLVRGKIVLCDNGASNNGQVAFLAGAIGIIMRDDGDRDVARAYPLPAVYLGVEAGKGVAAYLGVVDEDDITTVNYNFTTNPVATIFRSNVLKDTLAPFMAAFSSRGPNTISPDILKTNTRNAMRNKLSQPDVTAPGIDILAAWSQLNTMSQVNGDTRRVPYNFSPGTSMSCPHVTAIAAYIKSFHPSWSPAAIKSALMTTAFPLSETTSPDAEFGYGAGHIDPIKSLNPGLVYDANVTDYIKFLCGQGYNTTMLELFTGDNSQCTEATSAPVWNLNLPSFALHTEPLQFFSQNFSRTLTNVGPTASTYKANIVAPVGIKVGVEPSVLSFNSTGDKNSFVLKIEGAIGRTSVSASLVWDDGVHKYRAGEVGEALPVREVKVVEEKVLDLSVRVVATSLSSLK